ncbi:PhnD/SsuA/transferrin family substrate-binding protein [Pantoea sp. MQR6]|uniref:phosphate/phosphite/phosphonate ABC transporter substrate-binding protein n=1 Tax=Pantoea sp. MQR6 TaxID=2907307 RepID=UPI001FA9889D|nr:PhnD/SsuA/transferrin family substrate-binding protein [Pantoea sp. MQR6]
MTEQLSLPMYDIDHAATRQLTQAIADLLAQRGLETQIIWPDNLLAHWQDARLLLSQTCGYPLVSSLPDVKLVGVFHSTAAGCEGACYRSFLVARAQDKTKTLADFHGRRAVCNSADSHSGYNALRYVVAQQSVAFKQVIFSGGHRLSLAALRKGAADLAAIDCVTWALLQRYAPEEQQGLAIIGETPLSPALPLITSAATSDATLAELRSALAALVKDEKYRAVCAANLISHFSEVDRHFYHPVQEWEQAAVRLGVVQL